MTERTLFIFGGLPGAGKTTLARTLAQAHTAVYLRIDTIEHTMREADQTIHGPEGYLVAYSLAADNLRLGRAVVADSVNPIALTRKAWLDTARQAAARACQIEIVCSDKTKHRRRVETRRTAVDNLRLPSWQDVIDRNYEPWSEADIVIDTARQTPAQSEDALLRAVAQWLAEIGE